MDDAMSQERFYTTRNLGSTASGYAVPVPPRNLARPGRWIAPGETVEVLDYILRGGMLYVGTGMKDPNGTPEPSLINPLCAVQPTYGCYSTRSLDYWPNYSVIAPEARGAYLGWLASGRSHPKADIGFVFIYFYGLERRAFIDSYADVKAQEEWPVLIEEVRRLLALYGPTHRPFAERAQRFIEMLLAAKTAKNLVVGQSKYASVTSDMPIELKKELGQLALAGTPLTVDKALAWAGSDPSLKRGAAINRLPSYFSPLFSLLYRAAHPTGLLIPVTRTKLMMRYEPASQSVAGFGELGLYLDDIPDVTVQGGVSTKIQSIIDQCSEALGPYNRFATRNPTLVDALEAQVLLPPALWPQSLLGARTLWEDRVRDKPCVTTPTEVLAAFGTTAATGRDLLPVLNVLTSVRIGMEPELFGKLPKPDEPVVLFQMDAEAEAVRANPAYEAARVTLQLAHFVAAVESTAHADALEFINRQVDAWVHLTRAHRARLVAYSYYLHAVPLSPATLKKNSAAIEPLSRMAIVAFLCRVAQLGQDASPAMVKVLAKLYKMLELDPARLHSDLHAAAAGRPASLANGVTDVPVLDEARIAELQKDTAMVGVLLADIFVEDDEPQISNVSASTTGPTSGVAIVTAHPLGLDAAHAALVSVMLTRSAWSRAELQVHSDAQGLLLDGALEQINEAAFEMLDMPLVEGDDPLEINPDLPENLLL
jgi:hypothetical protein